MSKPKKVFLGIMSVLPLIMVVVYMASFFSVMIAAFRDGGHPEIFQEIMMDHMIWMAMSGLLIGLVSIATLIYFIIHAINNHAIDSNERLIWILVFVFAGMISKPVYWYMRIWNQPAATKV